jgi:hypothetical protein
MTYRMFADRNVRPRKLRALFFAALILNPPLALARAHKANNVTVVKMLDDPTYGTISVSCRIKGVGRNYICLIDSGATYTVVSDRVLEAKGPLMEMSTSNGIIRGHQRELSLTIADSLNLHSKAFVDASMPNDVDILVGQDILRQFSSVIFDYRNRQVELRQ